MVPLFPVFCASVSCTPFASNHAINGPLVFGIASPLARRTGLAGAGAGAIAKGAVAIGPICLAGAGDGGGAIANGAAAGGGAAIGTPPLELDDEVLNGSLAISLVIILTLFAWSPLCKPRV